MLLKKFLFMVFLSIPVLLIGCNPFGDSSGFEIVEMKMGKTIDNQGNISDLTDTFLITDNETVLWISWNKVKGENKGTVEWYDPDDRLYGESSEFTFTATNDTWTTWHKLPIAGTEAAFKEGDWLVYITLRGKYMDKKKFTITGTGSGPLL